MTKPRYIAILVVALALFISGCSAARKNYSEGRDLEEQGKLEEAMYRYAEAVKAAPEESEYRVKFLNTRMAAARGREQEGDTLLKTGNYAGAVAAYQTAAGLDPSQPRLVQKANNSHPVAGCRGRLSGRSDPGKRQQAAGRSHRLWTGPGSGSGEPGVPQRSPAHCALPQIQA